jgi:hypothetical protein
MPSLRCSSPKSIKYRRRRFANQSCVRTCFAYLVFSHSETAVVAIGPLDAQSAFSLYPRCVLCALCAMLLFLYFPVAFSASSARGPFSARGLVRFSSREPRLVHESFDKHGKGSDDCHCKVHQWTRNHSGPVFRGGSQSFANDFFDRYE